MGAGDRRYLRRAARHQALGPLGIALFAVLCCSIVATRLILVRHEIDEGFGDAARRFSAAALCSLPMLVTLFALAIANVRRPEFHKRFMHLLMVGFMIPAIARVFLVLMKRADAVGPFSGTAAWQAMIQALERPTSRTRTGAARSVTTVPFGWRR